MARKILITGSEGQLGKYLQFNLKDKYDVIPTGKSLSVQAGSKYMTTLDITDRTDVEICIDKVRPDIIINCAAYTDVDGSEANKKLARKVNVIGLQNLIHASHLDTYFIQISSDYIFDGDAGPYSENDHTYPLNYYGKTKLEAENILRGSKRRHLIIRPNVLYSEGLTFKGNFFAWVYKSLLSNKAISVVNDQISNPTYVYHLCQTIFQCIILNSEGIYHYGSDDYMSRYDFAISIANSFNLNTNLITSIDTKQLSQSFPTYIAKRPKHSGLKTLKIEDELGLLTYSTAYSLNMIKKSLY